MKTSLLIYDIPDAIDYPNPSPRLYSRAARVNLSCWIVPDHMIPHRLILEMTEAGCEVHVVPFAPEAEETVVKMVTKAIERTAAQAVAAAAKSSNLANKNSRTKTEGRRRIEAAQDRAQELLESLAKAVEAFQLNGTTAGTVTQALQKARMVTSAALRRAGVYVAASESEGVAKAGLTEAARDDAVPAGVLADAQEENGEDATDLREAFK